jgi:hypothetical protein
MSEADHLLFDAATKRTLLRLLQKRGVFVSEEIEKEELRICFGLGFSYDESLELKRDEP